MAVEMPRPLESEWVTLPFGHAVPGASGLLLADQWQRWAACRAPSVLPEGTPAARDHLRAPGQSGRDERRRAAAAGGDAAAAGGDAAGDPQTPQRLRLLLRPHGLRQLPGQ